MQSATVFNILSVVPSAIGALLEGNFLMAVFNLRNGGLILTDGDVRGSVNCKVLEAVWKWLVVACRVQSYSAALEYDRGFSEDRTILSKMGWGVGGWLMVKVVLAEVFDWLVALFALGWHIEAVAPVASLGQWRRQFVCNGCRYHSKKICIA